MRRLALASVVLLLVATPLHAEAPTLEEKLVDFLIQEDGATRLALALDIVSTEKDVAAAVAALPGAWTWNENETTEDIVTWERETADGVSHTICAFAPADYTTDKAWPLLIWLHGGVGRDQDGGGEEGARMFAGEASDKGFLVLSPSTQNGAHWWEPNGVALVRGALADMKRRYRVDADRVCVAGFSDGASGGLHLAVTDPTPFACFLSFMGNPLVSRGMGGPTWPVNLGARPVYAVNGGTDGLYPSEAMKPFFDEMKAGGMDLTWIDEPEVGHSLSFLEERWEEAYAFWMAHPREKSPKAVTWCTSRPADVGRLAWLQILSVAENAPVAGGLEKPAELALPDTRRPRLGFRIDTEFEGPGILIEDVEEGTPAAEAGLEVGDVILMAGDVEIPTAADIGLLRDYLDALDGEDGTFLVKRGDDELEVRAAPKILDKDLPARPGALGYDQPVGVARAKVLNRRAIEIETTHVDRIRLWLDPALLDVATDVVVKLNEKQLITVKAPWRVSVVLSQAVANGPGAPVYAGFVDLDVPVGP